MAQATLTGGHPALIRLGQLREVWRACRKDARVPLPTTWYLGGCGAPLHLLGAQASRRTPHTPE